MQYRLSVTRDGETIIDRLITADEVIQLMRPVPAMPDQEEDDVPRAYRPREKATKAAKGGRKCGNCGEVGHRADKCVKKK